MYYAPTVTPAHRDWYAAVDSGPELIGQWRQHRRNIREDYRELFGEDIDHADAVAIMSDTDNTGQRAVAWYGDILLSGQ